VLRTLLTASQFKNVDQLKGILTSITKTSLRNVFSHSFLATDKDRVMFIHRSSQGQYEVKGYTFTPKQFETHVQDFLRLALEFEKALGFSHKEVGNFAAAGIPLDS
jgi:hypothetical protein